MSKKNTYRVIRTAAFMFVAAAATCLMSSNASAQSCGYGGGGFYGGGFGGSGISIGIGGVRGGGLSFSSGYGGFGHGAHYGGYGGFNRGIGYGSYRPTYRRPVYHDTTHLDYHPGGLVRHGNHFVYIPGHYDVHRTGHWHR